MLKITFPFKCLFRYISRPIKLSMFTGHPHCSRRTLYPIIRKSSSSNIIAVRKKLTLTVVPLITANDQEFQISSCPPFLLWMKGLFQSKGLNSYPSGNHEWSPPSMFKGQKVSKGTKAGTIFEFIKLAVRHSLHANKKEQNIN